MQEEVPETAPTRYTPSSLVRRKQMQVLTAVRAETGHPDQSAVSQAVMEEEPTAAPCKFRLTLDRFAPVPPPEGEVSGIERTVSKDSAARKAAASKLNLLSDTNQAIAKAHQYKGMATAGPFKGPSGAHAQNPDVKIISKRDLTSEKPIYQDEQLKEAELKEAAALDPEALALEEKWIKSKSAVNKNMLPIELPLEKNPEREAEQDAEDKLDILTALNSGKVQVLQLPPCTFGGDFLAEKEIDEQELESIEKLNYHDKTNILAHLVGLQYDSSGFPLVNSQLHSLDTLFPNARETAKNHQGQKIGKLVKYDDGTVEFVAEKSHNIYDVLSTPSFQFHREYITFDDHTQTVARQKHVGNQYSTCLKIEE